VGREKIMWDEVNDQIPSTNHQIMTKIPMTEIIRLINFCFDYLDIGNWNLFGAWNLVIGISSKWPALHSISF
jgi:hypothetical protein